MDEKEQRLRKFFEKMRFYPHLPRISRYQWATIRVLDGQHRGKHRGIIEEAFESRGDADASASLSRFLIVGKIQRGEVVGAWVKKSSITNNTWYRY